MPDLDKTKEEIRALIAEIAEISEEEIKDEAKFTDDLGIDSMMALKIVASIEKKYKIIVPEEKIPTITSLNDVYRIVEENIDKRLL